MSSLLQAWALPAAFVAIANLSATWYKLVSEHVPKPYLVIIAPPNDYLIRTMLKRVGRVLSRPSSAAVLPKRLHMGSQNHHSSWTVGAPLPISLSRFTIHIELTLSAIWRLSSLSL